MDPFECYYGGSHRFYTQQTSTQREPRPFQRNLIATMEQVGPEVTDESYVEIQEEGLRKAGVAWWETRSDEKVIISQDRPALITERVIMGHDGDPVRQMQLVSVKDGVAYTLILSHIDGPLFEGARDEFRRMLLSFE